MLYRETQQPPVQPTGYRTTTEKAADVDTLRREVRSFFASTGITNSTEANHLAQTLPQEGLVFVLQYQSFIEKDIKGRGLPAEVVDAYLHTLYEKIEQTNGVDFGLQQDTGHAILQSLAQIADNMVTPETLRQLIEMVQHAAGGGPPGGPGQGSQSDEGSSSDDDNSGSDSDQPVSSGRVQGSVQRRLVRRDVAAALDDLQDLMQQLPTQQDLHRAASLPPARRANLEQVMDRAAARLPTNEQTKDTTRKVQQATTEEELYEALDEIRNKYHLDGYTREALKEVREGTRNDDEMDVSKTPSRSGSPLTSSTGYRTMDTSPEAAFRTPPRAADKRNRYDETHGSGEPGRKSSLTRRTPSAGTPQSTEAPYDTTTREGRRAFLIQKLEADPNLELVSNGQRYGGTSGKNITSKTHLNTTEALYRSYQARKHETKKGRGLQGTGLAAPRVHKSNRQKIEGRVEGTYEKPKPYKQLGRYLVNRDKLVSSCTLMVKRPSGGPVAELPSQRVSEPVAKVVQAWLEGRPVPKGEETSAEDASMLKRILQVCRCNTISMPDTERCVKTDAEREMDRFDILKGEIQAGNDNKSLIKEFKLLLVRFMSDGRIPRRQGQEILLDITSMGL